MVTCWWIRFTIFVVFMILSEGNRKSIVFTCFKLMYTFPFNVCLFKCSLITTATRLAKQHLHWVSWMWMIVFCISISIGEKTLHEPNYSGTGGHCQDMKNVSVTGASHFRGCKNTEFEWQLREKGFCDGGNK